MKKMWRALDEDDPEAILVCPPCTPFSLLQEWNFPRMPTQKVATMVYESLHHLRLAAKVFVFEHPLTSKAWAEEELQELMALPGVYVCTTDMCAYGMKVGGAPNRKQTKWITNSYEVAGELQRRCNQQHPHAPLTGGRAACALQGDSAWSAQTLGEPSVISRSRGDAGSFCWGR